MDTQGIIFDLQWKKKQGIAHGGEEMASIGIWDMADASLDWISFKSYLCQNLGTAEDVTFAYVDSEGDEIPIESECEFQEALKFARQRACRGRGIVLKVDKQEVTGKCIPSDQTDVSIQGVAAKFTKLGVVCRHQKQKCAKPCSTRPAGKMHSSVEKARHMVATVGPAQLTRSSKLNSEEIKDDSPPSWFKKYMQKIKNEIVTEVTTQVTYELQQALAELKKPCHCSGRTACSLDVTYPKKKKKKMSDEESSDANAIEQRECKLLRKIEKLQKREKKLEKKLDSKLEKLENRTKRMLEKKSHSKSRSEPLHEKKALTRKRVDVPVGTYLMDAVLLNGGSKPDIHIKLGECFTKVWQIMNTGTLPWTDKTELRLAWGTTGLEPQVTAVKCPALEPGDRGQICVTFKAPEFAGTFESYWHFYHMGVRFGHWISCAVVVDPKDEHESIYHGCDSGPATDIFLEDFDSKSRNDHAVDLTIRAKSDEICNSEVVTKCDKVSCSLKNNDMKRDAEYESDTDSDNLSIISHTVSVTSDSGDENKFVVVSMPASSTTEDQSELEVVHAGQHKEMAAKVKPSDPGPSEEKLNNLTHNSEVTLHSETNFLKLESEEEFGESSQNSVPPQALVDLTHTLKNNGSLKNIIFAVDMQGRTVPIKLTNRPKKQAMNIPSSLPACSYSVCSDEQPVSMESCQEAYPEISSTSTNHREDSRSETELHDTSRNDSENYQSPGSHAESSGNIIHILPETLMNGAVNVAASAISTAKAVISNLRTIPSRTTNSTNWEPSASTDTCSTTSQCMAILLDMGFTNKELNILLLKRYNNDISKVVTNLLSLEEGNRATV